MKIVILSDGKYGDRAANVIKQGFIDTKIITLEEKDPSTFLDIVNLGEDVEREISEADLLIIYVRHPDVVAEICDKGKPTILAVDFGKGFFNQVNYSNKKVIMPTAMCNPPSNTGIKEIDEYFMRYGFPTFNVEIDKAKTPPVIKSVKALKESPCSATETSLAFVRGKPLIQETIIKFGLNVRYECREPVSVLLSHKDMSDSSALLHVLNLLDALEKEVPAHFLPGTKMGEFARIRRDEYNLSLLDKIK